MVVITPLLPKVYLDIHHIANQWGNSQWWIWLCSRYWMRHYWRINSNEAHLVMLMMALSQQETGNQWNGPWLKIITMPLGGPVRSRVHNMPLLILIFDLRYYLRGWYGGPFPPFVPPSYPSNSFFLVLKCVAHLLMLGNVAVESLVIMCSVSWDHIGSYALNC